MASKIEKKRARFKRWYDKNRKSKSGPQLKGCSKEIAQKIVDLLIEDRCALAKWIQLFKTNPFFTPKKTLAKQKGMPNAL